MDPELMRLLTGGGGMMDPALGSLMAQNPEAIIPHLVSQGVAPPPIPPNMNPPSMSEHNSVLGQPPLPQEQPSGITATPPIAPNMRPPSMANMDSILGQQPLVSQPGQQPPAMPGSPDRLRTMVSPGTVGDPPTPPPPLAGNIPYTGDVLGPTEGGPGGGDPSIPMPMARPTPQPSSTHFAGAGAPREGTADAASAQKPNSNDMLKALQGLKAPPAPEVQKVSSPSAPRPLQIDQRQSAVTQLLMAMQGAPPPPPLMLQKALYGGNKP